MKIKVSVVQLGSDNLLKVNAKKLYMEQELTNKVWEKTDVNSIKSTQVDNMCKILNRCSKEGAQLVVFPELALTSFFPYFYIEDQNVLNKFFEKGDIRESEAGKLINLATSLGVSVGFGYAELTPNGQKFNSYVVVDAEGRQHKYRKVHIPGFEKPDPNKQLFQFEKGTFMSSDEGYPVFVLSLKVGHKLVKVKTGITICHDRRYNAPYLIMGMKGAQVVINGFNTPKSLTFQKSLDNYVYRFHYMPLQAQAITEGMFILSAGRTGNNFGVDQIAGSCIVSPHGDILAKSEVCEEAVISSTLNLNECDEVKAQKFWGERSRYDVVLNELMCYFEPIKGTTQKML